MPADLTDTLAGLVRSDGVVLVSSDLASLTLELRTRSVDARVGTVAQACGEGPASRAEAAAVFRGAGAAITGCLLGIASLGTVGVAPKGGNEGTLSCLAPHHVVILNEDDIVADLTAAMEVILRKITDFGGELVLVTGPSRTADIEMMSVVGVHGPLRMDVVVVVGPEA